MSHEPSPEGPLGKSGRRVAASDHLEVSTYLEISRHRQGETLDQTPEHPKTADEAIVVLDFGSQYSRLIARRVRECRVYCELHPFDVTPDALAHLKVKGFILSGGPASVYEPGAPLIPPFVLEWGVPVLGICYGMQALAYQLGGKVAPAKREYGHAVLHQNVPQTPLFADLPPAMPVWMSHGDQVVEMPPGFQALAYTENSPLAVIGSPERGLYGLQFHPEVAHTPYGRQILANFLYRVCGCRGLWTPRNFIAEATERIRSQVGDGKVVCALSGGVDSAVTATLVHQAVGDQLTCVFVNNGLLRREEPERVLHTFRTKMGLRVLYVDASQRFLERLRGVVDPEEKRRVVGEEFIRVFEEQAAALGKVDFLAQGTLYPDIIESKGDAKAAAKIKTHHNVGGLPATMRLRLVEPLRYLFKDEVREVGLALGLPEEIVFRQPFPGPGLAIRIIGEVTPEKLEILRACDWIVMDEIKAANLYRQLWQSFAVLTNVRTVGVMGDYRTYGYLVAVRAVTSEDAMTADWARLPYEVLARISTRIVNEVPQVNRVVYDITSKPPGTIEWE
ncbi:MAG: glutamine-hydrolyzing GMP synthase [Dehalococcoidia bacterium]|nr:glutamine-hydrolyzing GMP synthase [Dehalococcoidia bacterium]MDW8119064.1 glutamine-hydrolyzing GMP synthase [Chloroflexota bacterium]